jgi:hypothetical protein
LPTADPSAYRSEVATDGYLLIIGDRSALSWIVRTERMAFPEGTRSEVKELEEGDRLWLYTTRGCFKNPTSHEGRIIGRATVTSPVDRLDRPIGLAGRSFPTGCTIRISALAPLYGGVAIRPLVPSLSAFPNKESWAITLRRPLLRLPAKDQAVINKKLAPHLRSKSEVAEAYEQWLPERMVKGSSSE